MSIDHEKAGLAVLKFFSLDAEQQVRLLPKSLRTTEFHAGSGDFRTAEPLVVMLALLQDYSKARVLQEYFDCDEKAQMRLDQLGRLAELLVTEEASINQDRLLKDALWPVVREFAAEVTSGVPEDLLSVEVVEQLLY